MKRKLLFAASFVFVAWAATSCEALNDCKICKLVTTDSSNGEVTEGFETEYCGAKLITIENTAPKTVGSLTAVYECR